MRSLSLLLPLAAAACSFAPPPPPLPALGVALSYEPRAALPTMADPANVGAATRLVIAVRDVDDVAGEPLDTAVAAILADRGQPFRVGSALLTGFAIGPATAAAGDPAATATGVLGSDFATRLRVSGGDLPDLLLLLAGDDVRLLLRSPPDPGGGPREIALLEPLPAADGRVTLLHRGARGERTLAIELLLGEPASAADLAAVQSALLGADAEPIGPPTAVHATDLARAAIGAGPRRGALLALAARHELARVLDLVVCLVERELVTVAEALPKTDDGWQLERAVWNALLPAIQRNELPAATRACLRRHFGAAARDPTALELALLDSDTVIEFESALVADNLRALTDRRASMRVAATDWLLARGHTVADYDPLGPRDARKAALLAHRRKQQ